MKHFHIKRPSTDSLVHPNKNCRNTAAVFIKVLLLIQRTCLGNGLGITVKQDTAQYDGKQAVTQSSDQALCEDQAGVLFVDDDIADRRNQNPGNRIGDQVGDDKGRDLFCGEDTVFDVDLLGEEADDQAVNCCRKCPGPPNTAPGHVSEDMADEAGKAN